MGTSALVAAILILLRAEGNQHLHLWPRKPETYRLKIDPKSGWLSLFFGELEAEEHELGVAGGVAINQGAKRWGH